MVPLIADAYERFIRAETYAPAHEIAEVIEHAWLEPIPQEEHDGLDTMPVHVQCADEGAIVVVTRRPVNLHVLRRAR